MGKTSEQRLKIEQQPSNLLAESVNRTSKGEIDPKTAQTALRHSSVNTTLDPYTQIQPNCRSPKA